MTIWRLNRASGLIALILAGSVIAACGLEQSREVAQVQPSSTPPPPPIPSNVPLTPTPSHTPTITPTPTSTATWTPLPTETAPPTPTPFPMMALVAPTTTAAAESQQTGSEALTSGAVTVLAGPTAETTARLPDPYTVHLGEVNLMYLRSIYEHGQRLGRDRTRFTKIGDCHSTSRVFLQPIDRDRIVLGDYAFLETATDHFAGSFEHVGEAALDGMHMDTLLDPIWSDPEYCTLNESRVACEYRLRNASIALIFIQPTLTSSGTWRELFYTSLQRGVELSIANGIIPVLATQIEWEGHPVITEDTNRIIRQVGAEYHVPVWDFYVSTYALPNHGDRGNWHLSTSPHSSVDFSDARNMQYAMTIRNLEALQILHYLLQEVMY